MVEAEQAEFGREASWREADQSSEGPVGHASAAGTAEKLLAEPQHTLCVPLVGFAPGWKTWSAAVTSSCLLLPLYR